MSKIKLVLITLAAIVSVFLAGLFWVQGYQNTAIALEEQVSAAQSDIDVQEKRRVDLIYNLADCVKEYDAHEAETLKEVIEARANSGNIESAQLALASVTEAYPELKSDQNYKELMNELSITENLIAEYRSNYNIQVKEYSRYTKKFPNRFFLEFTGYDILETEYLEYDAPEDAPSDIFGGREK